MAEVRQVREEDAAALLQLQHQLDRETHFMMLEPDERTTTVAALAERIRGGLASGQELLWVAEDEGQLVGYVAAERGGFRRNRHVAQLVIGVAQSHAGQGLGARLFAAMEAWARQAGVRRLELTVMAHNRAGLGLYTKLGFLVEGLKRRSLCVDGAWVDEYYMGKLLD